MKNLSFLHNQKHLKRCRLPQKSLAKCINNESFAAVVLLAPSLVGVSVFYLIPFIEVIRRSFTDALGRSFKGFENYRSVLQNQAFQLAVSNTAKFLSVCIPLLLCVSLVLALLIRAVSPMGRPFQSTFLLPMAIPVSSIVLLWKVLFADNGLCNNFLTRNFHVSISFMDTSAAFWVLILTYLWKNCGYDMILWIAGLGRIPKDLYEAASVDGANAWQSFRHITLPGLRPTLFLTFLLSLINSFKVFREAYLVAGQYPHDSIYLLQHLFNNWFLDLDIERMTAGAVLVVLVILLSVGSVYAIARAIKHMRTKPPTNRSEK